MSSNSTTGSQVVNPLCIILVKNGSKGDRLLFRYPYKTELATTSSELRDPYRLASKLGSISSSAVNAEMDGGDSSMRSRKTSKISPPVSRRTNPYAVTKTGSDDLFSSCRLNDRSRNGAVLGELSDKDLANLLAVNADLSEKKFELKINEVRFIGHPTLMRNPKEVRPFNPSHATSIKLFNIVFCLNARASHSIVKCFYDLSKRLGIGLRHEEYRCAYVSREMKQIISKLDEECVDHNEDTEDADEAREMLFNDILSMSNLAKLMKRVYDDVCQTGFVKLKINSWVQVSFCLPHKIHTLPWRTEAPLVEPENIHRCLEAIRPYHAILLLVEREELVASFWVDASSTIPRLLKVYSPLKSLQTMAADADLTLSQVVEIASHLVYWAAAVVIYPMCESNVYVLAPGAPLTSPDLATEFSRNFPGISLAQTLADFSLPMPLGERLNPFLTGTQSQIQLVQLVCWLLRQRLLIQLHTYVYLSINLDGCGSENGIRLSEVGDDDGVFRLNFPPLELDDDDATISDSFSESTNDDFRAGVSPIPAVPATVEQEIVDLVNHANYPPGYEYQMREKRRRETSGDTDRDVGDHDESNHHDALERYKGTSSEFKASIKQMVKAQLSEQDMKLFCRLSKYFNGEYHLEEIMYRENIRRSQLMLLLDKFRDVLITVEKEDSDINFFKSNW